MELWSLGVWGCVGRRVWGANHNSHSLHFIICSQLALEISQSCTFACAELQVAQNVSRLIRCGDKMLSCWFCFRQGPQLACGRFLTISNSPHPHPHPPALACSKHCFFVSTMCVCFFFAGDPNSFPLAPCAFRRKHMVLGRGHSFPECLASRGRSD